MGRIRILPDALINRIAAGEVVERPASVAKELVENSLDADARAIEVRVLAGGKQRIEVSDDGCGMDRDDALLAFERHATSKVTHARDLEAIRTLGFRGEALSSIAAVSRLILRTCPADGRGTEIEVHGGEIRAVREAAGPRGTTIVVERLFYNVPARRKFLRADATELSHIVRWITRYALAEVGRRFHLSHGERRLIDLAPAADLAARVAQLHGREFVDRMLAVDRAGPTLRVRGLAGRPAEGLAGRDAQHLFVNGRAVQDRLLAHAIGAAYTNTMPRDRHPALFLFLELDPTEVDVNVHPQKTEVRFRQSSAVHDAVREALAAALGQSSAVPSLTDLRPRAIEATAAVRRATLDFLDRRASAGPGVGEPAPAGSWSPRGTTAAAASTDGGAPARAPCAAPPESGAATPGVVAVPLAQFRDSYIVAEDAEGLVLVDQHAAHERVLFERYLAQAETNAVEVQRLLFPLTLELTPLDMVTLEHEQDELARLGFRVEPFGERAARLDGVPSVAAGLDAESVFRDVLGEAARCRAAAADVGELRLRLVTTASCKAAIKVNHPLTRPEMQRLLEDLGATVNPTTCPHGRPLVFRLTVAEIERAFQRR